MSDPVVPGLGSTPPAIVASAQSANEILQAALRASAQAREIARKREALANAQKRVRQTEEFKRTAAARAALKTARERALDVPEVRLATERFREERKELEKTSAAQDEARLIVEIQAAETERSLLVENLALAVESGEVGALNRPPGLVLPRDRERKGRDGS